MLMGYASLKIHVQQVDVQHAGKDADNAIWESAINVTVHTFSLKEHA